MMDEKRKFLADRLLSEELPVTYRLLSRALNLHVNNAKGALHEFHQYQNGQRANSVFATYLVSGTKQADATQTITLVAEENLQDILAEYDHVDSLHVYSLAPHAQRDLSLLSDVAKAIPGYGDEQAKYGTILNPKARRRERKAGMPLPLPPKPVKEEPKTVKEEPKASESKKAVEPKKEEDDSTASSGAGKKSVLPKRGQKSSIMQSFAKAAARPKTKPAVKEAEDTAMSDDGEADDDLPFAKTKSTDEQLTKSRKEREADLRRMMEEYDKKEEDEDDVEDEDEEMEEAEPEPEPEPQPEPEPEKADIVASSSNGRRRGKRRVMKKKRILDDQGYMVTIQEEGWESFSEEEAAKPAPAPKVKKVSKGGQGSIMSFFAKK